MAMENKEIVYLNVGGQKFATSKQTLINVENTFFTSLLSHENDLISALKDKDGFFFIDRDPDLFKIILNYLRSGQLLNIDHVNLDTLLHEAEFYGVVPLVKRLKFCYNLLNKNECSGSLLFQGIIKFDEDLDNPEYSLLGEREKPLNQSSSSKQNLVVQIVTDNYFVSIGYTYQIRFYKSTDTHGFRLLFEPYDLKHKIDTIAFYRQTQQAEGFTLYVGIYFEEIKRIQLWCLVFNKDSLTYQKTITSNFSLRESVVNSLFFIGPHLTALSYENGLIGVSHAHNGQWLIQSLTEPGNETEESNLPVSISSYDKVGNDFLILATNTGLIYLIDMDKFPLRIKDRGLLINELFKDPDKKMITSISCYLTTKSKHQPRKWFEIVYGTVDGTLRVLIPQIESPSMVLRLFQTFKVHLNPIRSVMLSDRFLISLCDKMHVRTYSLIRFRDHLSTQPGSDPYASFQIAALDNEEGSNLKFKKPDKYGPLGHQIDGSKQIFIQRLNSDSNKINLLCASNGKRVCSIKSVDKSPITTCAVLDEEITLGNRTKILFLTGHVNGNIQIWNLGSAFELMSNKSEKQDSVVNYS